ncbi:unnamed protein product [Dicrocoelium dendriticum]|nr:unnamed protein product [Dicrocoelium dendriticum]
MGDSELGGQGGGAGRPWRCVGGRAAGEGGVSGEAGGGKVAWGGGGGGSCGSGVELAGGGVCLLRDGRWCRIRGVRYIQVERGTSIRGWANSRGGCTSG